MCFCLCLSHSVVCILCCRIDFKYAKLFGKTEVLSVIFQLAYKQTKIYIF